MDDDQIYEALSNKMEPEAIARFPYADDRLFTASIAISMRRIADALEKGTTVVVAGDDIIEDEQASPWTASASQFDEIDPICSQIHADGKPCSACWIPF